MSIPLIGHDRQIQYINKSSKADRLPHAYLFHGPSHIGKLTVALTLAQSFFCESAKKLDIRSICHECSSCRAIAEYRHPAVAMLDTAHTLVSKKETRKEIPIEDIRELKRMFSFASQGTAMRLAIINEVEKMSEEASNAFLKLLEEPGANTLLILITTNRDLLLPTIISRTQAIGFSCVGDTALKMILKEYAVASDEEEELLMLAAGRPGVLVELCRDPAYAKEERALLRDIRTAVRDRDMVSAFRISEKVSQDPELREKTISYIFIELRNALIRASGDPAPIAGAIKRVSRIAQALDSTNVNPRLGMDVMFLECIKAPLYVS